MARYGLRVWKFDLFNYVSSYTETVTRHLKPIFLRKMPKSYTQPIPRHTSSCTEAIPRQRLNFVMRRGIYASETWFRYPIGSFFSGDSIKLRNRILLRQYSYLLYIESLNARLRRIYKCQRVTSFLIAYRDPCTKNSFHARLDIEFRACKARLLLVIMNQLQAPKCFFEFLTTGTICF